MKIFRLLLLALTAFLPCASRAAEPESTPAAAVDPWDTIKESTYPKRADLIAGAARLTETIDAEIEQLNAKRATLPETSVKDWDFAMKELKEARVYLKFTISSLSDASSETWNEAKEKVAQAWQRAKDACAKVKASTTT